MVKYVSQQILKILDPKGKNRISDVIKFIDIDTNTRDSKVNMLTLRSKVIDLQLPD